MAPIETPPDTPPPDAGPHVRPLRLLAALLCVTLSAVACSGTPATTGFEDLDLDDWSAVRAAAEGATVDWWLFGGDDRINSYIDEHVVPAADELGITLRRTPVADTADAVNTVLSTVRAGEEVGTIDLIWINGENFANGVEADLWREDWAGRLPNAELVDPATVDEDFGIPVEGRESPWSRALFVFAHDGARLADPPRSFDELLRFARANPGRFTYPAPPDFTGSAFVRQVVAALGEDAAFAWLAELQPLLWEEGRTFPADEAELNALFADGQVDIAMSYDPAFVVTGVDQGRFPMTTRPFVLEEGTLQNTSYVAMPVTAPDPAGAMVVADLLLEPGLQAIKADPAVLGVPTVLDLQRLDPQQRALFSGATDSPYLLTDYGTLVEELPAARVEVIEQRWIEEIRSP